MLVYQKTMFDRYYCRVILSLENFGKTLQNYYNGMQKHKGFVGFENACSRAKTVCFCSYPHLIRLYCICMYKQS